MAKVLKKHSLGTNWTYDYSWSSCYHLQACSIDQHCPFVMICVVLAGHCKAVQSIVYGIPHARLAS